MKQILLMGILICTLAITAFAICYGIGSHERTGSWQGLVTALGVEAIYLITVFAMTRPSRDTTE